jgi:soluble lytic murein transglycosylase-like protein
VGLFIDEISKIDALIQQRVAESSGHEKVVKNDKTDFVFNDMLNASIEKNKGNKVGLDASNSLSREKLKLLAEIILVQLKSTFLSFGNDSEEKSSNFNIKDLLLNLSNNSSIIDSQVSKIKQPAPVMSDSKSHNIENVINEASEKYKVNSDLIRSVIRAESNFNPDATSSKGAMGLMQLMPETAKDLGVERPYDISENVMGGTNYLKTLLDRYEGNIDLALAAYNWGMGNLERNPENLPRETRDYIAKINKFLNSASSV